MSRRSTSWASVLVAVAAIMLGAEASAARADFTPLVLLSGSTTEQADYAFEPTVSANGQFVVFTGSQAGVPGIYRKNLQTGELDLVAPGPAGAPSASADGRYISFTTAATDPAAGTGTGCTSVYVRDMTIASDLETAYTLASAPNGSTDGLVYGGSATNGCPGGGASAADRVALSADGRHVTFTVVGASNLMTGPHTAPSTPPAQVAVRDLDTDTTTLVSQTAGSLGQTPAPVLNGGAMTDNSTGTGSATGTLNSAPGDSTAAISADGTTVAWEGIDIPQQAPASSSDQPRGHPNEYDEPLWRRIADGPGAPTLRILGGSAPDEPCPSACNGPLDTQWDGEENPTPGLDQGPERGSFVAYDGFTSAATTVRSTLDDVTPQLSANGQTVAVLSTQPATGQDPVCGQVCSPNVSANAFVVRMAPGLSRSQAVTRLTEWASQDFTDFSLAGPLENMAISPEGNRVAFVTRRVAFPFSPPALITPQLSGAENEQLYLADLADGTLQLVSLGFDGQPANGVVDAPSMSANNGPIAFASAATNLVYGALSDVTGGDEVFTTSEIKPPAVPGVETISPAPANPFITPEWVIGASVRRQRDGSLMLFVSVPGDGSVAAGARAAVPVAAKHRAKRSAKSSPAKRSHQARTAAAKKRKPARGRGGSPPGTATRTIASARARSHAPGVIKLHLRAQSQYRALVARVRGLYANVQITFTSAGHPRLTERIPVDFVGPKAKRRKR